MLSVWSYRIHTNLSLPIMLLQNKYHTKMYSKSVDNVINRIRIKFDGVGTFKKKKLYYYNFRWKYEVL